MLLISLAVPTLFLMALAVFVPRTIEKLVSENIMGLGVNLVLSSFVMWMVSSALFVFIYLLRESEIVAYLGQSDGVAHFLRLGAKSIMVWAPIVLLVVVTAPGRWREAVW